MIEFKPIGDFKPGILSDLLVKSYAELLDASPDKNEQWRRQWENDDITVFSHPHSIGRCLFLTCIEGQAIGYFSRGERQHPVGYIGQNCILPEYRG